METNDLFVPFPKIARFSREVIVTEKIDGTNAQIYIGPDGEFLAGSRTRWLSVEYDNFGFAAWALENKESLLTLGVGRHFGEWWGKGIQRGYGADCRMFSLFNVDRWADRDARPHCCSCVPLLWRENMDNMDAAEIMRCLKKRGSFAAPGFMKPEGIVIYHTASGAGFKKTFDKDGAGKTE